METKKQMHEFNILWQLNFILLFIQQYTFESDFRNKTKTIVQSHLSLVDKGSQLTSGHLRQLV